MWQNSFPPERRFEWGLVGVPLAIAVAVRVALGGAPAFPSDDAYISQHSAHFLGKAVDPSYLDARPLTGATSLLHVIVLWMFMQWLPPAWAVETVSWLGAAVYLWGAARLAGMAVDDRRWRAALVAISLVLGSSMIHVFGGQETGWAMAAVTWALYWLKTDTSGLRLPVLAGVLPWIRPDLGLLSVMIVADRFVRRRHTLVRDGSISIVVSLAGMFSYWLLSDSLWPVTMAAKVSFFAERGQSLATNLSVAAESLGGWFLTLGPATVALMISWRDRTARMGTIALGVLILGGALVAPSMLRHNVFRYLQPLSMPVIVLTLATASVSWRGVLVLSTLVWALVSTPAAIGGWTGAVSTFTHNQSRVADWFNHQVSGGTSVLVHDAGFLSEYTQAKLTDLVGLKSPGSLELHRALTGPSHGERRSEAVHLIACRGRVDYFVVLNLWDDALALTEGLRSFGWAAVDVFQSSEDQRHYTVFRLGRSSRCESE